jgi:protein-S-isoprenylcysteine O-methyltransferase Ste14
MNEKLKQLEELQAETIEQEKIVLAIYAALGAFSLTCLLRLVTLPSDSILVIIASCLFSVSAISFLLIVISMQSVLHKNKDMHIGHVLAASDSAEHPRFIGITCLSLGFLTVLLYISIITFVVGLVAFILAQKHHEKFIEKMDTYAGAREALGNNEKA